MCLYQICWPRLSPRRTSVAGQSVAWERLRTHTVGTDTPDKEVIVAFQGFKTGDNLSNVTTDWIPCRQPLFQGGITKAGITKTLVSEAESSGLKVYTN